MDPTEGLVVQVGHRWLLREGDKWGCHRRYVDPEGILFSHGRDGILKPTEGLRASDERGERTRGVAHVVVAYPGGGEGGRVASLWGFAWALLRVNGHNGGASEERGDWGGGGSTCWVCRPWGQLSPHGSKPSDGSR